MLGNETLFIAITTRTASCRKDHETSHWNDRDHREYFYIVYTLLYYSSYRYESLSLLTQCVAIIQNNASLANSIPSYVKIPSIIASKLKLLLKSSSINDQYLGLKCAKQLMVYMFIIVFMVN